ncbi:MAG: HAD-IA family hydrolase [Patescibacteria group bacterium]
MKELEAVLFDVDGTLLNTKEFIYQAYEHTFKSHNLPSVPREELDGVMGKLLEDCYKHFVPSSQDLMILCETHRTFQTKNLHLSVPFPNTKDTLNKIKKAEIKIAAITSRSQRTSTHNLELAGIKDRIDVVISAEDVTRIKPHPEPLLKALKQLGVKPEKAVMVGDTDADILAGKNAKTKTIGVTYGFHGKRIVESNPDYVVDDIAEIIPIILA